MQCNDRARTRHVSHYNITSHILQEQSYTANSTQDLRDSPKLLVKYIHGHVMQISCRWWKKNVPTTLLMPRPLFKYILVYQMPNTRQFFKSKKFQSYHKAVTYDRWLKNLSNSDTWPTENSTTSARSEAELCTYLFRHRCSNNHQTS